MASSGKNGQVSLNQMLRALDKDVASGVEKKLKKLSKKKAIKVPLSKNKADQVARKVAYESVSKEVDQWDPIVKKNRQARKLIFPLDQEPEVLASTAECLGELRPMNSFESELKMAIDGNDSMLHDNSELSKAEEKYLKAISAEEAQERHRELQRMRVLLSSYAAKMRRQKAIKSKSYRRLLKHERIRRHVKRVESDKDLLMEEIERLKRLRARERASLKHKNTGKWAKHAKFRAKYDEQARQAMIEQIGLAEKFLARPGEAECSSSDKESSSGDESESYSDQECSADEEAHSSPHTLIPTGAKGPQTGGVRQSLQGSSTHAQLSNDQIILSSELNINDRLLAWQRQQRQEKRRQQQRQDCERSGSNEIGAQLMDEAEEDRVQRANFELEAEETGESEEEEEDDQRRLMSEAFAGDDVVAEFERAKELLSGEEQPKDKDNFLPGWGGWAGPGIRTNRLKRAKYIVRAKRVARKDDHLSNVIISEQANNKMKGLMVAKLPRGVKSEEQFRKILTRPVTASFVGQMEHREAVQPRICTKLGARIEPMKKEVSLRPSKQAKWVS